MVTKLVVAMVDSRGRPTHRTFGMEDQALLADYVTAVGTFLTALAAVTDLGVTSAVLRIPVAASAFAFTADANKDVGMTAVGYVKDGDGKKAGTKVPGIKMSLVGTDGTVAITGVVATYLAKFEDADDFNLSDGEQIDPWLKATLDG